MSANLPKSVMVTGEVAYTEFEIETINEDILAMSGDLSFFLEDDTSDPPIKYWRVYGNMTGGGIVSIVTAAQTYFVNIVSRDPDFRIVLDQIYTNVHAELDWLGNPSPVNATFTIQPYSIDNASGNSAVPWSLVSAETTGPASVSFTAGPMLPVSITLDDASTDYVSGVLSITITYPGSAFPVTLTAAWQSYRYDQPEVDDLVWWSGKASGAPMPTDLDANPVHVAYPSGISTNGGDADGGWYYNPDIPGMSVQIKRMVGDPAQQTVLYAYAVVQPGDEALDDGVAVIEAMAVPGQIPIPARYDSTTTIQVRNDFPTPAGEPAYRYNIKMRCIPSAYRVPPGYLGPVSVSIGHASDYEFVGYIAGLRASDTLGLSGADGDLAGDQSTVGHAVRIRPFTAATGLQEIIITVEGEGLSGDLRLYSQRVLPRQKRKFDDAAIDLKPFLPYEMRCIGVCNAFGLGMSLPEVEDKS